MESHVLTAHSPLVDLSVGPDLWGRVFMVAPLVVVGTVEGDGYDLAPKHMAMPLSWEGLYGFVCAPTHATYRNLRAHPEFTVSFPRPEQILQASLAAGGRFEGDAKPSLAAVATIPARVVEPPLVDGCVLYLECELERIVDGLGPNSLVVGRVVAGVGAARGSARAGGRRRRSRPPARSARLPRAGPLRRCTGQPRVPVPDRLPALEATWPTTRQPGSSRSSAAVAGR